jgi:cytochrome c biogenesis protein CcmG/thiol:disulfide interchange protein DsbE
MADVTGIQDLAATDPTGTADPAGAGRTADPAGAGVPPPADGALPAPSRYRQPPRKLRAFLLGVVLAVAIGVFLFVGLGTKASNPSGVPAGPVVGIGSVAPDFTLPSLTGGPSVNLDALGKHRGRPVVLNFFASWCTPCQEETPLLARTADAEQAKGSTIQFVGVDVADSPADAIPFVKKAGLTYPIGSDADLRVTANLYGLNGEPNTFFIDANGHVVGHVIGALKAAELQSWLPRLAGAKG